MQSIYEEWSGTYEDSPDAVSVCVLKSGPGDSPRTPLYLVVFDSFQEGHKVVPLEDKSRDFEAIRWAQKRYDDLLSIVRSDAAFWAQEASNV